MTSDIRDLIWKRVEPTLYISREQYFAALDGWKLDPFWVDGKPAFVMMTKGPEFHLDTFLTGHRFPMKEFLRRLRELMDRHGYVTTRAPKCEPRQHEFNRRFGFVRTGEDAYDVHYRLDRIRSARKESTGCQLLQ